MGIKEDITKIYVGYYDRAPDPAGLDYWIGRANGGMTLSEIAASFAVQPESIAKYPYLDNPLVASASAFVTSIYNNLFNRAPDAAGLAYWVAELAAGKAVGQMIIDIMSGAKDDANGNDLSTLNNKVAVGVDFASDLAEVSGLDYENNAAAKAAASAALAGVTDAAGTITTAQAATDAFVAAGAGVGQAFALTTGTDSIIGTDGVDIISATAATLTALDSVDGADGMDTLSYTETTGAGVVAGDLSPAGASIVNVEKLSVASAAGVALNAADMGTFSDLTVAASAAGAVSAASTSSLKSASITTTGTAAITGASTTLESVKLTGTGVSAVSSTALTSATLKNTTGVLTNTAAAGTREVAVSLNNSAGYADATATTLNVSATGAASTAATIAGAAATAVNISGDVALTVGTFGVAAAATVTNTSTAAVTITPALLNDTTYVGSDAADTITLGLNTKATTTGGGDDTVTTGSALGTNGTLDAGAGTDTLAMSSADAATASATTTFGAAVSNFETLSLAQTTGGSTDTVNMSNLDDIAHIKSAGTAAATGTAEVQTYTVTTPADASGGHLLFGTVDITLAPSLTTAQVAAAIQAQSAAIIAANPLIASINTVGNVVTVTYQTQAADQANLVAADHGSGVTFGGIVQADGTTEVLEQQTITVGTAPIATGNITVGGVTVSVSLGDNTATTAAKIQAALDATKPAGVGTVTVAGSVVTVTFTSGAGDAAALIVTDPGAAMFGGGNAPAVADDNVAYVAPAAESQTVVVTAGTDANGGSVVVNGAVIELAANLTVDQVGVTIAANAAAIMAADTNVASVNYNTATDTVTIGYTAAAGNVGAGSAADNAATGATIVAAETTAGVAGLSGGKLNLTNVAANATVELTGPIGDASSVALKDATGTADVLNVKLNGATNTVNTGVLTVAGVETVNVEATNSGAAAPTAASTLLLNAAAATTVNVMGNHGVDFSGSTLAAVTTFDASGVTGTGAGGATTFSGGSTAGSTISGGAGNDVLSGNSAAGKTDTINGNAGNDTLVGGAGNDTINGGAGTDTITGGLGVDTLTGGADADTFVYTAAAQSNSVNVDVITDFVSGTDKLKIDVSGAGTYAGEAVGYGAVLTALANTGTGRGVLDTSTNTLYVDVDGNGVLNTSDYAIQLTGVTDLAAADFMFV